MNTTALEDSVLQWLRTMKGNERFSCKLSAETDGSIFTTCFALFILDLFNQVGQLSENDRRDWIEYIQSFQNKREGYFEPEKYFHFDHERNRYQLTCFCLSALRILGTGPKYPLFFVKEYLGKQKICDYLLDRGCHEGRPASGNKAMFLAIFLTHEYERTQEPIYKEMMKTWFEFHDRYQNSSGFWGDDRSCHSFHGLQNGLHQLVVYWYWKRPVLKLDKIVDVALRIQSRDGFFAPLPGGEACHDYDAIHILVNALNYSSYKSREIRASLSRAAEAILSNQKSDGGFCQSLQSISSYRQLLGHIPFILSGGSPYGWYYRLRRCVSIIKYKIDKISTGWTQKDRQYTESNLWDTWFRCLSLAEIGMIDGVISEFPLQNMIFHKSIGLGYFDKAETYKHKSSFGLTN